MDDSRRELLRQDLLDQWRLIERVLVVLQDRRRGAASTAGQLEGLAYQIHNLYSACEQLFELVARAFENQIEGANYHVDLLRRMRSEIKGVRPALLTEGLSSQLNELRGFRHFFRHAYSTELDPARVEELTEIALEVRKPLRAAVDLFIEALG